MTTTSLTTNTELEAAPLVLTMIDPSSLNTDAKLALYLAVIHHGMACLSMAEMKPASKQTVTVTAEHFLTYFRKHENDQLGRGSPAESSNT